MASISLRPANSHRRNRKSPLPQPRTRRPHQKYLILGGTLSFLLCHLFPLVLMVTSIMFQRCLANRSFMITIHDIHFSFNRFLLIVERVCIYANLNVIIMESAVPFFPQFTFVQYFFFVLIIQSHSQSSFYSLSMISHRIFTSAVRCLPARAFLDGR
jgi:hypothetical protein